MASCQTKEWVVSAPVAKLTVSIKSQTDTSATLSWKLQYIAESPSNSVPRPFVAKVNGKTVYNDSYAILNKQGTYTIASGEEKIAKTHKTQSISFSVSVDWKLTWSGTYAGTLSASGSISVGKKTSYTVSYNANGGSGQPSAQTKWHGETLTLTSTEPTRSGYTFVGWGTSTTDTSSNYSAGGSYTANEDDTLYAIWSKTITLSYNAKGGSGQPSSSSATVYNAATSNTFTISSTIPKKTGYAFLGWSTSSSATSASYSAGSEITLSKNTTLYAVWRLNVFTVTYNANGGTNAPSSQTKTYGTDLVLTSSKPTRQYHNFLGWSTSKSGSVEYSAGGVYKTNENITLYAVWEVTYIIPRITGVSVIRCDADGNPQDDGTYALVKFNWATDDDVSSIKIYWKASTDLAYGNSQLVEATDKSGSVNEVVGGGALSEDFAYDLKIEVIDNTDRNSATQRLGTTLFPLDLFNGGKGVTIGEPAKEEGFNVKMIAKFFENAFAEKNFSIVGDLAVEGVVQPLTILGSQYFSQGKFGLNLQNSDLYRVNSIYFADAANAADEGLLFARGNDLWDTFRLYNGKMYITTGSTSGFGSGNWSEGKTYDVPYVTEYKATATDIWGYRKWSNGMVECWLKKACSDVLCDSAWGNVYVSDNYNLGNYPVTFAVRPIQVMAIHQTSSAAYELRHPYGDYSNTASHAGYVTFIRPSKQSGAANVYMSVYTIGYL